MIYLLLIPILYYAIAVLAYAGLRLGEWWAGYHVQPEDARLWWRMCLRWPVVLVARRWV